VAGVGCSAATTCHLLRSARPRCGCPLRGTDSLSPVLVAVDADDGYAPDELATSAP